MKIAIKTTEKLFIKGLNVIILDIVSTPMRIFFAYAQYIIGLKLNQLTTFKSIIVVYIR